MVGGSIWELKIDPKRLREEIKKRYRKKSQKKHIKSYKNALGSNGPKDFKSSGAPREPPWDPQNAPSALKMTPRGPPNASKTIFGSKMMIFQKGTRFHKINIFEGGRVSLGVQNRPQEAPGGNKKRLRKNKKEKIRKNEHQERQEELQKAMTTVDLWKPKRRPVQFGRPGPLGEPQELPKWGRESPQTLPKPSLDRKWWFFKNRAPAKKAEQKDHQERQENSKKQWETLAI